MQRRSSITKAQLRLLEYTADVDVFSQVIAHVHDASAQALGKAFETCARTLFDRWVLLAGETAFQLTVCNKFAFVSPWMPVR